MATIETMVLSRRGEKLDKVRDGEVVATAGAIRALLDKARTRASGGREPRALEPAT